MNKNIKEIRRALESVRAVLGPDHPALASLTASVERLEGAKRGSRIAKSVACGPTKEQRRAERNNRVADIRAKCLARAGNACELCGASGENFALHLHHLLSGGLRRHREEVGTCIIVDAECHAAMHNSRMSALVQAHNWAARHSYTAAQDAITRRIEKIEGTRRAG